MLGIIKHFFDSFGDIMKISPLFSKNVFRLSSAEETSFMATGDVFNAVDAFDPALYISHTASGHCDFSLPTLLTIRLFFKVFFEIVYGITKL